MLTSKTLVESMSHSFAEQVGEDTGDGVSVGGVGKARGGGEVGSGFLAVDVFGTAKMVVAWRVFNSPISDLDLCFSFLI